MPNREKFFKDLTKQHITEENWNFINQLWDTFQLKNLGELHDLYMETDVILLADVVEVFIVWSMKQYQLDPVPLNTSPGLSWSA